MNVGLLNGFQKTQYTTGPVTFAGVVALVSPISGNVLVMPDQPGTTVATGINNGTVWGGGFEKQSWYGGTPQGKQSATIDLGTLLANLGFRIGGGAYPITTTGAASLGATTKLFAGVNAQVGTTYTMVLADASKVVTMNNAGGMTLTIPANSSVAYGIGTEIPFYNKGAGTLTLAITTDTLLGTTSFAANKGGILVKVAATTWLVLASA